MKEIVSSRHTFMVFLVAFFLAIFFYVSIKSVELQGHQWTYGDWLINYSSGFVRRGLSGEFLQLFSRVVNPIYMITILQILLYSIFLFFSCYVICNEKQALAVALVVFSPFAFLFPVNDMYAVGRKEIIFLAVFAFLIFVSKSQLRQKNKDHVIFIFLVIYPIFILLHEALILGLPFILALYLVDGIDRKRLITAFLLFIPNLVVFAFCIFSPVTSSDVEVIISSIATIKLDGHGAIEALAYDSERSIRYVKNNRINASFFISLLLLTVISFIPLLDTIKKLFSNKYVLFLLLGSLLGFCLLSVVAIDWGRWIHVYFTALFLFLLKIGVEPFQLRYKRLFFITIFVYAFSWSLPHSIKGYPISLPLKFIFG